MKIFLSLMIVSFLFDECFKMEDGFILGPGQCYIDNSFPVPPRDPDVLFYIQRSLDANTVLYKLNKVKGVISNDEPVKVFWIKYAEDGRMENLSRVQQQFAYGISRLESENDSDTIDLRIAANRKVPFYLIHCEKDDKYYMQIVINGKRINVARIYLSINGGSFWVPNVECVEVKGSDPVTGRMIKEQFKP